MPGETRRGEDDVMLLGRAAVVALAAAWMLSDISANATVVGGGGSAATDCLLVFDAPVNVPASNPRHVDCVDGDTSCDADGIVNGVCQIQLQVCASSTMIAGC